MKNIMQHYLMLLLLSVFSIHGSSANSQEKFRTDSIFNCAYAKCGDTPDSYDFYMTCNTINDPVINGIKTTGDFWLVFVDQMPDANWEHPCRYIYVSDKKKENTYATFVVDSTLPPHSEALVPYKLTQTNKERSKNSSSVQTYGLNGSRVSKIYTNPFSSHTYAVILSGGLSPVENLDRYWNDCSYIYKTLTKNFGVPKDNVKVLMSDGRSPEPDRNVNISLSPDLDSSPLDLDGDGEPDIDYSASKDTLAMVFSELKSKLTDNDHLLVFVTDHGGKDDNSGESYINLWNGNRLYPAELAEYVKDLNAGYISFVLGQCYSGGFILVLKANNHIVLTACGEDEMSYRCRQKDINYNEFLYNWISALNRTDIYGNTLPVSETSYTGKLLPVSLKRAFDYAVNKDAYNKGRTFRSVENPQISILSGSTAEDLAMDSIPPTVYLYITKNNTTVKRTSATNKISISNVIGNFSKYKFWTNRDIWLRNQDDGLTNHEHETPNITEDNPTVYVYTMVKNRGVKAYNDKSVRLTTFWAKSSLVLSNDTWNGILTGENIGGKLYQGLIKKIIQPCDSTIIRQKYEFSEEALDIAIEKGFKMCLLSTLTNKNESQVLPTNNSGVVTVWNSDRYAQRNQYTIWSLLKKLSISTFPSATKEMELSLLVFNDAHKSICKDNALNVKLTVPNSMVSPVLMKGCNPNINNPREILLTDSCSIIQGFTITPYELDSICISANFVSDRDLTEPLKRTVNMAIFDENSGEVLGGEQFDFIIDPRKKMEPEIEKTVNLNGVVLKATNVFEDAVYEWYDKDGNLVGKGKELKLSPSAPSGEYTLRVVASKDNAMNTATIDIAQPSWIKDISTAYPGTIDIGLNYPATKNMTARISSSTGNSNVSEYKIDSGVTHATFQIMGEMPNIMQMSLTENGKIVDTRKIIVK